MNYQIAAQIAQNLNSSGSWNVEQVFENQPDRFYLIEKDSGMKLFIREAYNKPGMVNVQLSIPRIDDDGNLWKNGREVNLRGEEIPSMNVSVSKTPAQIAKAIETRILSESLRIHEKALQIAEGMRNVANATASTISALSEILGTKPDHKEDMSLDCNAIGTRSWSVTGYGDLRVNGGGKTVEFKLSSVPVSKALKLAAFLKAEIFNGQA